MNTRWFVLVFSLGLAGCASNPPLGWRPGPYVRPELVMVPADQAHYYGIGQPSGEVASPRRTAPAPTSVRSVQTDSEVTALQYNRYPDPARPDQLMHEAHIVYRRESLPRWRLQPPSGEQQILVGPRISDGRGEIKPLVSQELESFMRQQRDQQREQQDLLGKVAGGMKQLAEQQQQLARQVAKLEQSARGDSPEPVSSTGTNDSDRK